MSDIKSAVILCFLFISRNRYLGDFATNRRDILHDGRPVSQT